MEVLYPGRFEYIESLWRKGPARRIRVEYFRMNDHPVFVFIALARCRAQSGDIIPGIGYPNIEVSIRIPGITTSFS